MKRSGGYRLPGCSAIALAAATLLAPLPAIAGSTSYENAFQRRVSDAGSRDALDGFVVEAVRQGQYDQALSTLEETLLRNPDDLAARLALARIYYQIGSYDLAEAHLDQAAMTAGFEQYEREIAALRARIERGLAGYQTHLAVSAGGEYESVDLVELPSMQSDGQVLFYPYAMINGGVIRHLDTASRDELRLSGTAKFERGLGDPEFLANLEAFDHYMFKGQATYSKGLPDIIDTLRFELSGYGLAETYGGGRELREIGTETALIVQPTVESQIRLYAGYGWLGNSQGLYGEQRVRYGADGDLRIAPGVALGVHVSGYQEWGTAPVNFLGGDGGYAAQGFQAGASVSHLLHVFEDGRSWIQEAGAAYSHERILDYATFSSGIAGMADRDRWELYWNYSVQIVTRTELDFGVSYGEDRITDTSFFSNDRTSKYWRVKAGLTYRFD